MQRNQRERYAEINRLKQEKGVTILAHYYMPPELQELTKDGGIADYLGDSLGLSLEAKRAETPNILFCGVRFMAETALIVNPSKRVFMPAPSAGCSLASSINAEQLRELKAMFPGVPVMGYVNTYAETKTEMDICCTSRNAVAVAASLPGNKIIFVPDLYMGQNLQRVIGDACGKELILWKGTCEVHEQFKPQMMNVAEDDEVLMHWEVPGETAAQTLKVGKGMVGSTGDILSYVRNSSASRFYLASECDLGVSLKKENPGKEFITPCVQCSYMKQNTLESVLDALKTIGSEKETAYEIILDSAIREKAAIPVHRMLMYS